jgi:hypothetical protein
MLYRLGRHALGDQMQVDAEPPQLVLQTLGEGPAEQGLEA